MKKTGIILLILLLFTALWLVNRQYISLMPKAHLNHPTESCTACHTQNHQNPVEGLMAGHQNIGCAACHLGRTGTMNKDSAHRDMVLIPGNLSNAHLTCSTAECHPGIDWRVKHSIMNTMSGVVSVNRAVFGEDYHDSLPKIQDLGQSAADNHLRDLCASCHVGASKDEIGPIHQLSRGGGCLACHLNYSSSAKLAHADYHLSEKKELPSTHAALSIQVSDDHCFGCHSRSGRISTSYQGWHETLHDSLPIGEAGLFKTFDDGRVYEYQGEDVHHALGLSCIDCHGHLEVMGDGKHHKFQVDAKYISCEDCHFSELPTTKPFDSLEFASQRIIRLRDLDRTDKRFIIGQKGQVLANTYIQDHQAMLTGKLNHKTYRLSAPAAECTAPVHQEVSCNACHTQWAPQCISCHTDFQPQRIGYDLLAKKDVQGEWQESTGPNLADYPALGVSEKDGERKIQTFTHGMILTIDKSNYTKTPNDIIHRRIFAPIMAHTIGKEGRTCRDCHLRSNSLGYGHGTLSLPPNPNQWSQTQDYENWEVDKLPLDAWIGFLQPPNRESVTRDYIRSLTVEEQKRVLAVGSCLTCHEDDSSVMRRSLLDYNQVLGERKEPCYGK